jgi:hypothetical protein
MKFNVIFPVMAYQVPPQKSGTLTRIQMTEIPNWEEPSL